MSSLAKDARMAATLGGKDCGNIGDKCAWKTAIVADTTPQETSAALCPDASDGVIAHAIKSDSLHRIAVAQAHKKRAATAIALANTIKRRPMDFVTGGRAYAQALDKLAQESIWLLYIAAFCGLQAAMDVRAVIGNDRENTHTMPAGDILDVYAKLRTKLIAKAGGVASKELIKRADADTLENKDLIKLLSMNTGGF